MFDRARFLNIQYEASKKEAKELLAEVVKTQEMGDVLKVFSQLEDLLPTTRWIPREEDYPLFRAFIDRDDTYRREGVYEFFGRFEEEVWFFTEATVAEKEEVMKKAEGGGWNPYNYVPMFWEILRNGNSKFTLDW